MDEIAQKLSDIQRSTLESVPFFSYLNVEARQEAAKHLHLMVVRKGRILCAHGSEPSHVYFILDGEFVGRVYSSLGKEVWLKSWGPGDIIGALAAIDDQCSVGTVAAETNGALAKMSQAAFVSALSSSATAASWLASRFSQAARELTNRVFELSTLNVGERLNCELLRLALQAGIDHNHAILVRCPTQRDLAIRLGTHREAISRAIGHLIELDVVHFKDRHLEILDVHALAPTTHCITSGKLACRQVENP
jgi:CRP-like cAMP-binding protein